ncbi:hypothetical protein C6H65_16210 [Photorhabdus luminescens]|nr:hypothetical protein C6H65_16210 [Photorhabdus luminescens]
MCGTSYGEIFRKAVQIQVKKKAGKRTQKVSDDDILHFLENTLAFDCALILAALAQFLFTPGELLGEKGAPLARFQKSLKNGLPDTLSLNVYRAGFADRFISQAIRDALRQNGYEGDSFEEARKTHLSTIEQVVRTTPAYFSLVLNTD